MGKVSEDVGKVGNFSCVWTAGILINFLVILRFVRRDVGVDPAAAGRLYNMGVPGFDSIDL